MAKTEERRSISQEEVDLVRALYRQLQKDLAMHLDISSKARDILCTALYRTANQELRRQIRFLLIMSRLHSPVLERHIEEWHREVMNYVEEPD